MSETPEEWNSQSGGIPRGVELPGEWNSQGSGTPRGPEGFITQGALQSKSQTHSHTNKHTHTQTLKIPHSLHLETLQLYKKI